MIKESVDNLNGRISYSDIKEYINRKWIDVNQDTITAQIIVLSVNHDSRIHYPENHKPRLTNSNSPYDLLFNTDRGEVEKYSPDRHGIWEIYKDENDKLGIKKFEEAPAVNTFLFAWNPDKWNWTTLEQSIEQLENSGKVTERWSCVSHKTIKPGVESLMTDNTLYYGDNLDPPFNSNANYNVLFAEQDGAQAAAQIKAFEDTWKWDATAAKAYQETVESGGKVSQTLQAFRMVVGDSNMLAYLSMMAPRLAELRRVLIETGSIYLHCDPTASHYLKLLMDAVFGPQHFQNEIVWKRTGAHNDPGRYGANIDILLFYTKGDKWTWNELFRPHEAKYLARFHHQDSRGFWTDDNLSAKGLSGGGYEYEYKGVKGYWRCPVETMQQLDQEGRLHFTNKGGIRLKRYLEDNKGTVLQALWEDIPPINSQAAERLGYPTQKPEALLERIIKASSNEGDVVLDPFCGCGTAIAVAQRLNRPWIGIDITHLAITLIKHRLKDAFLGQATYKVIGEPVSLPDAETLAQQDQYQFQWWALGLVGARPVEQKKGADKGIDGRLYFHDGPASDTRQVVISVKAGHTGVSHVRDLRGVLDREKADIGVLIAMQETTGPMRTEAAGAGFYASPVWGKSYPRLQILTIAELLSGKGIEMPPLGQVAATFKKAPKAKGKRGENLRMPLDGE